MRFSHAVLLSASLTSFASASALPESAPALEKRQFNFGNLFNSIKQDVQAGTNKANQATQAAAKAAQAAQAAAANRAQGNRGQGNNAQANKAASATAASAAAASTSAAAAATGNNKANNGNNASNGNNNGNNANNGNANAAAAGLTLDANAVQSASAQTGQENGATAGQSPSATDNANFINFCAGKTLTNGKQVTAGSCNGIVMGNIPAQANMVSTIILSPKPGEDLAANQAFTVQVQVNNLQAGSFTNPDVTYYAAPQDVRNGKIVGHTHITIQDLGGSITPNQAPDASTFKFFKGINDAGNGNGLLSTTVTAGLPAGNYRVCTMASASNHQPVLMPVAQRGAQDDCTKFTVGQGNGAAAAAAGNGNAGGNNAGNNANAASATAAAAGGANTAAAAAANKNGNGNNNNGGRNRGGRKNRNGRRSFRERRIV